MYGDVTADANVSQRVTLAKITANLQLQDRCQSEQNTITCKQSQDGAIVKLHGGAL